MNNSERNSETEQLSGGRAKADVLEHRARMNGTATAHPMADGSFGLTKREYMAAAIMPQLVGLWHDAAQRIGNGDQDLAQTAVRLADALLLELAK